MNCRKCWTGQITDKKVGSSHTLCWVLAAFCFLRPKSLGNDKNLTSDRYEQEDWQQKGNHVANGSYEETATENRDQIAFLDVLLK